MALIAEQLKMRSSFAAHKALVAAAVSDKALDLLIF
jgi:hypothetical protein